MNKLPIALIDHQIYSLQHYGGIIRYFEKIKLNIKDYKCKTPLLLKYSINGSFVKRLIIFAFNTFYTIIWMKFNKYDVYHASYYELFYLPFLHKKPLVITIHDMIYEEEKEMPFRKWMINNRRILIKRANAIICVSKTTEKLLMKYYPEAKGKTNVIYHGLTFGEIKSKKINLGKYILYVGGRGYYKQFWLMIGKIKDYLINNNIKIICVGGGKFTENENITIYNHNLGNFIIHKDCTDTELANLYSNALCLIVSSRQEGFCIPIIEAFQCGCPVLANDIEIFHEIGSHAIIYFNVNSARSTIKALEKINQFIFRKSIVRKGIKVIQKLSWNDSAKKTIQVYNTLV